MPLVGLKRRRPWRSPASKDGKRRGFQRSGDQAWILAAALRSSVRSLTSWNRLEAELKKSLGSNVGSRRWRTILRHSDSVSQQLQKHVVSLVKDLKQTPCWILCRRAFHKQSPSVNAKRA